MESADRLPAGWERIADDAALVERLSNIAGAPTAADVSASWNSSAVPPHERYSAFFELLRLAMIP